MGSSMSSLLRVNTIDVRPAQRLDYWNQNVATIYGGMSIDSQVSAFNANLIYADIGQVGFMRAVANQSLVRRSGNSTQQETILVHIQVHGSSVNKQGQRSVCLQPGDIAICENRSPYSVSAAEDSDIIALELPYPLARQYIPDIDKRVITPYSTCSLQGRLLFNILQTIQAECASAGQEQLDLSGLQNLLMEALKQVITQSPLERSDDSGKNNYLLQKVKNFIQREIGQEYLTTKCIADAVGLSERRVQSLFANLGTTPTLYIRDARLDRAAERLRFEPTRSITSIAHDAGYNDSAYFARCFRKKYGVAPKDYRAG